MVRFVDVDHLAMWAAETGVEHIVRGLVDALEADFRRWPVFDKKPRIGSHSEHGVIELMPTSDGETYGFKFVNGHPINASRGLQTVTGFGALADVDRGHPIMLSEMTLLTALRTAATSAMVAKALAPADAHTMALFGAGAQSEFQALAMRAVLGIDSVRVWDTDPAALDKFIVNAERLGFDVHRAAGPDDALVGVQIITTCTADKRSATIITDDMLRRAGLGTPGGAGVHINAIGGDCPGKTELDIEIVKGGTVFVEYPDQTFIEGEIQTLPRDWPITEFWQVLTGDRAGRTAPDELTIFDSVGFAIEDFTALRFLDAALTAPGGERYHEVIELIAHPDNPKNLFGMIEAKMTETTRR